MSIKTHFEGKIGKQPELKISSSDKPYVVFGVATEQYVGEGKGDERNGKPTNYKTSWVNVLANGRQAEYIVERFSPGDTIVVEGELEIKSYEKKDRDGNLIDGNAVGLKVFAKEVAGPFRAVPKNNGTGISQQPDPAQQASAPRPSIAPRQQQQQQQPQQQEAAPRQAPSQRSALPVIVSAPQGQTLYDDDIPF